MRASRPRSVLFAADTAAHLVDRVLPEVRTRQWALKLPYTLRFLMAYDSKLIAAIHSIFTQAVFASLRRRAGLSSFKRLKPLADGRLLYRLKKQWRDGTNKIIFSPLELMKRLAALVPAPRFNKEEFSISISPVQHGLNS